MEHKARVGVDNLLWWSAPEPLAAAPSLEVRHPTLGSIAPALTQVRADVTLLSIDSTRTVLTASAAVAGNIEGPQGRYGRAWVVPVGYPARPVKVWSISGDQVTLAEPLDGVNVASATLTWARYSATLPAGTICATAQRNIPFTVTYSARYGADAPSVPRTVEGKIHVVRQVFSTQLDHDALLRLRPGLVERVPAGQEDFGPQIESAEAELVLLLREQLVPQGYWEDDLIGGQALQAAHAWLVSAHVYDDVDFERARVDRENARRMLGSALAALTIDADGDGVADEGETGRSSAVKGTSVGGNMPTYDSDTRAAFGMEH